MISTGNDIIALNTIDISRTEQVNFYSKIITSSEKTLFDQLKPCSLSFANFVWLSWSVKESVYKYLHRITPSLVFSPSKINIKELNIPGPALLSKFEPDEVESIGFNEKAILKGTVSFSGELFYFRSTVFQQVILSVVNNKDDFNHVNWGLKLIDDSDPAYQSKAVREFVLKKLQHLYPENDMQIIKSPFGYPVIAKELIETDIALSLAHHDCYIAYSFKLSN